MENGKTVSLAVKDPGVLYGEKGARMRGCLGIAGCISDVGNAVTQSFKLVHQVICGFVKVSKTRFVVKCLGGKDRHNLCITVKVFCTVQGHVVRVVV